MMVTKTEIAQFEGIFLDFSRGQGDPHSDPEKIPLQQNFPGSIIDQELEIADPLQRLLAVVNQALWILERLAIGRLEPDLLLLHVEGEHPLHVPPGREPVGDVQARAKPFQFDEVMIRYRVGIRMTSLQGSPVLAQPEPESIDPTGRLLLREGGVASGGSRLSGRRKGVRRENDDQDQDHTGSILHSRIHDTRYDGKAE